MLSIVVIGRNEGETLANCFKSIHHFADFNHLSDYEIVYVDSDSNDNSIEIAKRTNVDKIFRLEGDYNTPIAMNTGIRNATYDTVLILAGDMQLFEFSFHNVTNKLDKHNIVTGDLKEHLFKNGKSTDTYIRDYPKGMCSGVCFIKKELFFIIGGMDERMTKGQDYDFFIRAAKMGYDLINLDLVICEHFTESYNSKRRLKKSSINNARYRAYLLRKNIFSFSAWKLVFSEFYPIFFSVALTIIAVCLSYHLFILALGLLLICSLYKSRNDLRIDVFLFQIFKNGLFLIFICTFFPSSKEYNIEVISDSKSVKANN